MTHPTPGNWQTFDCFLPGPELAGKEGTHYLWEMGSNAGGLTDACNVAALKTRFAAEIASGDVIYDTCSTGLRGVYIYGFLVRMVDAEGRRTRAADLLIDAQTKLSEYPLLDEDLFSTMEENARFENLERELKYQLGGIPLPTVTAAVLEGLDVDHDYIHTADGPYPDEGAVSEMLVELGLVES